MELTAMNNIKKKTPKVTETYMNDKNTAATHQDSYSESVAHLSTSYENAQRTIRFLDTKASGTLVFVTSLIGATILLAKWVIDIITLELSQLDSWLPYNGMQYSVVICSVILISLLYFVYKSVSNALSCLSPKEPGGTSTVLFPYWFGPGNEQRNQLAEEHLNRFLEGPEFQLAKEEYATQIRRVGVIVNQKLDFCEKSIISLKWVILCFVLFAISTVTVFAAANGLFG